VALLAAIHRQSCQYHDGDRVWHVSPEPAWNGYLRDSA
jgi:hypothetical protein